MQEAFKVHSRQEGEVTKLRATVDNQRASNVDLTTQLTDLRNSSMDLYGELESLRTRDDTAANFSIGRPHFSPPIVGGLNLNSSAAPSGTSLSPLSPIEEPSTPGRAASLPFASPPTSVNASLDMSPEMLHQHLPNGTIGGIGAGSAFSPKNHTISAFSSPASSSAMTPPTPSGSTTSVASTIAGMMATTPFRSKGAPTETPPTARQVVMVEEEEEEEEEEELKAVENSARLNSGGGEGEHEQSASAEGGAGGPNGNGNGGGGGGGGGSGGQYAVEFGDGPLGIMFRSDEETGEIFVVAAEGSAASAGIELGDVIEEFNGYVLPR